MQAAPKAAYMHRRGGNRLASSAAATAEGVSCRCRNSPAVAAFHLAEGDDKQARPWVAGGSDGDEDGDAALNAEMTGRLNFGGGFQRGSCR